MNAGPGQPLSDLVPGPKPCPGLRNAAVILLVIGAALSVVAVVGDADRVR